MTDEFLAENKTENPVQDFAVASEVKNGRSWREKVFEIIKAFIVPIAIVLLFRFYVVQPFIVRGASMEPSFENKEYLIIDEITPMVQPLSRGAVVVFRYPFNPSDFFIKRIIGLPGERVVINNGRVSVKNTTGEELILNEPYLGRGTITVGATDVTLSDDSYFVMGDNRNFSSDSRQWGVLSGRLITGRAILRLWPPERAGIIKGVVY
ncbi:MAG: signal peptidase I [Patescibacteria group bacterium]